MAAGHEGENALQFRKRCKADQLYQTGQSTQYPRPVNSTKNLTESYRKCLRQIREQVMDVSFNLAKTLACHILQGPLGTPEHYIPDEHDIYTRSTQGYGSLEERERQSTSMKRGTSPGRFLRFHPYDNGNNYYY